jgi:transposase InsO family protein
MVSTPEGVDTMPFAEVTRMDERRRFVLRVEGGAMLSQACREFGITRPTGRKWVRRALESGLDKMAEKSRAPRLVANRTALEVEGALLACRIRHENVWGAKKLVVRLKEEDGIEIPLRTADRILKRYGCVEERKPATPEPIRFERAEANHLLQMDFKGIPKSTPYFPLTVLDDADRFCLRFVPVPNKTGETVFSVLWEMFGEYGLPIEMLCDNGDCWGSRPSKCPTAFEAKLMLLGIKPIHGKPRHPQTQGKVERFHGTVKRELGRRLVQPTLKEAEIVFKEFVDRYNWVRPHEALKFATPGSRYQPSTRKRPDKMPEQEILEGVVSRKVDEAGFISYRNVPSKVGKGLAGYRVVIQEDDLGPRIYFAGFPIAYLFEC